MSPEQIQRIERELAVLREGGQLAKLVSGHGLDSVIYQDVPVQSATPGDPTATDVLVRVPEGYPAAAIDLAGLSSTSVLLPRVAGGSNPQGTLDVDGRGWTLVSYHPHNGGGGPPWDPSEHGFHTYLGELIAWLAKVS